MTKIPNMFRTVENSNYGIVSRFRLIAEAMLLSVLGDSGFDVSSFVLRVSSFELYALILR
jgi:hypothetical protein